MPSIMKTVKDMPHSAILCVETETCIVGDCPGCEFEKTCTLNGGNNYECGSGSYEYNRNHHECVTIPAAGAFVFDPANYVDPKTGATNAMTTMKKFTLVNTSVLATKDASVQINEATNLFAGTAGVGNGFFHTEEGVNGWPAMQVTIQNNSLDHIAEICFHVLGVA